MNRKIIGTGWRQALGSASSLAMAALLPLAAGSALAQTAPPPAPPAPPGAAAPAPPPAAVEEVIVTGTRIKDTDAGSANPITVVSAQDIAKTESAKVEDYFRKVPALDFTGGLTTASNDVGLGASFAGIRNLGPQRTLVLLNGQRFPLTDIQGAFDAVDLNNIPVPMIERIDVLRDGASSVYGADAVAGVINIITKNHFNGIEIGANFGISTYGDAQRYGAYSTMGSDFDKGNILINVTTQHEDPVLESARPEWSGSDHAWADYNGFPQHSTTVSGIIATIKNAKGKGVKWYFPDGLGSGILNSNAYTLGSTNIGQNCWAGGGITQGDYACGPGSSISPGVRWGWDYTLTNVLPQGIFAGLDRRQINVTGNYEITPDINALVEGFYTDRQSIEILAPEPIGNAATPAFPNGLDVAAFLPDGSPNPYNPTSGATAANPVYGATKPENIPFTSKRMEDGNRYFEDSLDTYRMRAALEGTVFTDYTWEAGYFYGQSSAVDRTVNSINFYHVSQELGMNACGTEIGCGLANYFGAATLTPAQAAYIAYTDTDTSQYAMSEAYGNIGGPIWDLPAGQIKGVVGFEYRTDSLNDNPSPVAAAGDAAVFATPTSGAYATASGYAEVNVPLLKDLPFVKMLTLDVSGRYDYNTVFGRALTDKVGLDWAINDDFRFRGAHSTGFRAPQVRELFGGQFLATVGGNDPCAPGGADYQKPTCEAALAAVGANDGSVSQLAQLNVIIGGNPTLKPETSQEWTMGGVFTPTFVPGLSMTADYYTILVRSEIASLDANAILAECYGGVPYVISQQQACVLAGPRQQGSGDLGNVAGLDGNVYDENTDGIDLHVSYAKSTEDLGLPAWGSLSFSGDANYLLSDDVSANGVTLQRAGSYLDPSAWPRWKAVVDLGFAQDNWSVTWSTRYYGGVHNQDGTSACEYGTVTCPATGALDFAGNEEAGTFYHDISGTYQYKNINLTVGIDNLLDKNPPFFRPSGSNSTLGSAGYDKTGRFFFVKSTVDF